MRLAMPGRHLGQTIRKEGLGQTWLCWPGSIPTALWSKFPCLTYAKAASQGLAPSSFLLRELRLASCLRPYFLTF